MATPLTDTQKAAIRRYLGFSEAFHQINTRLESMMDDLANRSQAATDQVVATLASLAAIDAKLQDAALNDRDFETADEVKYNARQLRDIEDRGRKLINQLAITFEITVPRDYFGADTGDGMLRIG